MIGSSDSIDFWISVVLWRSRMETTCILTLKNNVMSLRVLGSRISRKYEKTYYV